MPGLKLRPLTDEEMPYLRALGGAVRELRRASGVSGKELALQAGISETHFWRITAGRRRTKRSTLSRMVALMVEANPSLGPVDALLGRLCDLAGPAIVVDTDDLAEVPPPTPEEVERLLQRYFRANAAARRAYRRWDAADSRLRRLNRETA